MSEQLSSPTQSHTFPLDSEEVRRLSRSPHPYHRQYFELPHSSESFNRSTPSISSPLRSAQNTDDEGKSSVDSVPRSYQRSTNSDDSGTEADDEHFLKGLPAPRLRLHKGLRGIDGTPSPLLSPAILEEEIHSPRKLRQIASLLPEQDGEILRKARERLQQKRRIEIIRRMCETALLIFVGAVVCAGDDIRKALQFWKPELWCLGIIVSLLLSLYPLRIVCRWHSKNPRNTLSLAIPAIFDPAPLLYPPTISMFVAAILSANNISVLLPAMTLAISSLPRRLIPCDGSLQVCNTLQWALSVVPVLLFRGSGRSQGILHITHASKLNYEALVLIHPLHQALSYTLQQLTTTSLLPAELQLLSIALLDLLLLAQSPQAVILKALLWIGGMGILVSSGQVLKWAIILARIPKWRFRRSPTATLRASKLMTRTRDFNPFRFSVFSQHKIKTPTSDDDVVPDMTESFQTRPSSGHSDQQSAEAPTSGRNGIATMDYFLTPGLTQRRFTLPAEFQSPKSSGRTSSGRRKRSMSSSVQPFLSLTSSQATFRKWLYAGYVYACIAAIILLGVRRYVGKHALYGHEPIGWALGYLFGDIPIFRMEVVTSNLQRWILLPPRSGLEHKESCPSGWVQHLRHASMGEANTRLVLSAYWLGIIIIGLAIVFRLSAVYEVDTRRKVFHFMMVAMLLPATYVDPTFAALALSLILAIFLLLDIFRACQLPPLSKHLAYFLTPYVDGRDLKGPVVISHIFLLIGCAIPLWLTLGSLPRTGTGPLAGWEVPIREVSMVSGVICVGMGDAAASLIGRRYGRHKWFWSGGKSIEGSVAFATAVCLALCAAKAWLRVGGWVANNEDGFRSTLGKAGVAASVASLTEAVLTGGNDNVVVPVVLWLCVKGLDL